MQQQRRTPRQAVTEGWIDIGGRAYPLKDWSAEGFFAQTDGMPPPAADDEACILEVKSEFGMIQIRGRYHIVRRSEGGFAGNWILESKSAAHDLIISHFFTRELREGGY